MRAAKNSSAVTTVWIIPTSAVRHSIARRDSSTNRFVSDADAFRSNTSRGAVCSRANSVARSRTAPSRSTRAKSAALAYDERFLSAIATTTAAANMIVNWTVDAPGASRSASVIGRAPGDPVPSTRFSSCASRPTPTISSKVVSRTVNASAVVDAGVNGKNSRSWPSVRTRLTTLRNRLRMGVRQVIAKSRPSIYRPRRPARYGVVTRNGSPTATTPPRRTRAYTRLHPGCVVCAMRATRPSMK